MMLPMLVSSAQRLPWPSCSMPNLVGKASVKSGSRGIYASPLHATGPHQQKVSFAKKEAPPRLSPAAEGDSQLCPRDLHVASLVGDNERRGEAVFVVEGAAAERVAHPRHRRVAWGKRDGKDRGREERENL